MDTKSKEPKSEHEAKYRELQPRYKELAQEIDFAINKRLEAEDIKVADVTHRAKTVDSFLEKIERKGYYYDPLKKITDLAGVRVVCLWESDYQKVREIVCSEFNVIDGESKRDGLGTDKMGYQDKKFIVKLGNRYSDDRYDELQGLECEIQFRTVLQDAWAKFSWYLDYKSEASIPEKLKRNINNVSSMMEIAQVVFDDVREKRDNYIEEIKQKSDDRSSFLSLPVDYDTLAAYTKREYKPFEISEKWHPLMVRDLNLSKYHSLQDIDEIVKMAAPAVLAYCQQRPDLFKSGTGFLTKSLGFIDEEFRERHPFAKATLAAFEEYKHLVRAKPTKK
ncbi:MAG: GTP pyrophosphokinase [Candidatus Brocadiales bacterium]